MRNSIDFLSVGGDNSTCPADWRCAAKTGRAKLQGDVIQKSQMKQLTQWRLRNQIPDLSSIGSHLVADATDLHEPPRTLLQELFPYVWEASRKMSTRGISNWLKTNYDLHISQATVSRALRNPEKQWEAFAEFIEPAARVVAQATDNTVEGVLYGIESEIFPRVMEDAVPILEGETDDDLFHAHKDFEEAVEFLKEKWFGVSGAARSQCHKHFVNLDEEEKNRDE